MPVGNLLYAAARIFVQRNIEFFYEFGIFGLNIEIVVLGVMLAALGAIIAQFIHIVEANHVAVLFGCVFDFCSSLYFGIEVYAVLVLDLQQPAHMIDAGDKLAAHFDVFHVYAFEKRLAANLNAVTQAHRFYAGVALHKSRKNSHRVGIVEKPRVWAYFFHVARKSV